ncbi:MAG: Gfo/Idh/MocA family oxidoreductase, partial [Flavitalea sp.]
NDTHFPYTKLALEAGKHVVLEKPFANNTEQAKELVDIAARTGKMLSVYQNRRYVSDFRTIKQVLDQKLLGDIHTYEAHYHRYRAEERPQAWREKPEPGSGILFDLGAHLIDQALYLFGWPESVTADVRLQRPHAKTDDYFDLRLDYGFLRVRLTSGMLVREAGPRFMIHGTKGSFLKSGEDVQEALLRAGAVPVSKTWGAEPESMYGTLHTEKDGEIIREIYPSLPGNYGDYYRSVYQTLKQGEPLSETPQHGYNTIRIIEAAFESSKQKSTIAV